MPDVLSEYDRGLVKACRRVSGAYFAHSLAVSGPFEASRRDELMQALTDLERYQEYATGLPSPERS